MKCGHAKCRTRLLNSGMVVYVLNSVLTEPFYIKDEFFMLDILASNKFLYLFSR